MKNKQRREINERECWWGLVSLIALSFIANIWLLSRPKPESSVVVEHDTVWRDTIINQPTPAETIDIGKTVYLRIPYPEPSGRDTIHDSIDVPVPIVQKRYEDSLYTAWVSGVQPNLDSIRLYQPTIVETVTRTIVKSSPRLSVGIQGGVGVGVISRQPDIYVGLGIQWRLWPK